MQSPTDPLTHAIQQELLPAQLHGLGWHLFRFQQFVFAWHLPSLAHTGGHESLTALIGEIRRWSELLNLIPEAQPGKPATYAKMLAEYQAGLEQLRQAGPSKPN
jgi:hypothetical protein